MKFNSEFNFKDSVYTIQNNNWGKVDVACEFCGTVGRITGMNQKTSVCPKCMGNGYIPKAQKPKWMPSELLTIGQIRIEATCQHSSTDGSPFNNYGDQSETYNEIYMCYETGINSGTLHKGNQLFHSIAGAQVACDKLNNEKGL